MPMVKLDPMYQDKLMRQRVYGKMRDLNISQERMARELGCSQSAFSRKVAEMRFSLKEARTVFRLLKFSEAEIIESMKGGIT